MYIHVHKPRAGREVPRDVEGPVDGLFWAAGFSFSRAEFIQDVPYDPALKYLFFGEVKWLFANSAQLV